jgi:molybdopterin converting factor small subunit
MKVKVLFFGATADVVGEREIEFVVEEPSVAESVFAKILNEYPALPKNLLFAVNQEYSKGEEVLRDGDELAVFTPVSGG